MSAVIVVVVDVVVCAVVVDVVVGAAVVVAGVSVKIFKYLLLLLIGITTCVTIYSLHQKCNELSGQKQKDFFIIVYGLAVRFFLLSYMLYLKQNCLFQNYCLGLNCLYPKEILV